MMVDEVPDAAHDSDWGILFQADHKEGLKMKRVRLVEEQW